MTLLREALVALCERTGRFQVTGQCAKGDEALRLIERLEPDLALLDANMTGLHTLEVVSQARDRGVRTRCLVLAERQERKQVMEALRCGASGYLLKSGPARHLLDGLDQVLAGGKYLSPDVRLDEVVPAKPSAAGGDPLKLLSTREYQVFSMLIDGVRAKEIAARLDLSPKTVDTYRASLMRKLDIHDVAGLVKFAISRKLTSVRT
jgi:DNA-binding NarL/FixJ family response regulator